MSLDVLWISMSLNWVYVPRCLMNFDVPKLSLRASNVPKLSLCLLQSLKLMVWTQFQWECLFITSNVIVEDPWRLRCKIEYMSPDIHKLNICISMSLNLMSLLMFCCLLWSLWQQRMGTSVRVKLYCRKLCSSVAWMLEFKNSIEMMCLMTLTILFSL
jgi:hypothetical protein